jgi:hypothetical protein
MVSIYGLPSQSPLFPSTLFHTYDNNIIFTNALQINNIINTVQVGVQHIYAFISFIIGSFVRFFHNSLVRSFIHSCNQFPIMIRNYYNALLGHIDVGFEIKYDFYFVGSMFLLLLLCYMFKTFYDMVEALIVERESLDTRIRMTKGRVQELASENNKLTLKLESLQQEFDSFNNIVGHHFNVQIRANKNVERIERKIASLKKQIQMYE